jgi:hypothetical protein
MQMFFAIFRAEVFSTQLKILLSERKTKQKQAFVWFYELVFFNAVKDMANCSKKRKFTFLMKTY